jgi:hypothetical protein
LTPFAIKRITHEMSRLCLLLLLLRLIFFFFFRPFFFLYQLFHSCHCPQPLTLCSKILSGILLELDFGNFGAWTLYLGKILWKKIRRKRRQGRSRKKRREIDGSVEDFKKLCTLRWFHRLIQKLHRPNH